MDANKSNSMADDVQAEANMMEQISDYLHFGKLKMQLKYKKHLNSFRSSPPFRDIII